MRNVGHMIPDPNMPSNSPSEGQMLAERDRRVENFFIAPMGEVWIVYHVSDIPAKHDDPDYSSLMKSPGGYRAKDDNITFVTASLHFTYEKALEHTDNSKWDDFSDVYHTYELNEM